MQGVIGWIPLGGKLCDLDIPLTQPRDQTFRYDSDFKLGFMPNDYLIIPRQHAFSGHPFG